MDNDGSSEDETLSNSAPGRLEADGDTGEARFFPGRGGVVTTAAADGDGGGFPNEQTCADTQEEAKADRHGGLSMDPLLESQPMLTGDMQRVDNGGIHMPEVTEQRKPDFGNEVMVEASGIASFGNGNEDGASMFESNSEILQAKEEQKKTVVAKKKKQPSLTQFFSALPAERKPVRVESFLEPDTDIDGVIDDGQGSAVVQESGMESVAAGRKGSLTQF